jgi:hypothetical protein
MHGLWTPAVTLLLAAGIGCERKSSGEGSASPGGGVDTAADTVPGDTGSSDTGADDTGVEPTVYHQPPIQLTIDVHGHNYSLATGPSSSSWLDDKLDRYESDKAQILWVAALAESVDARANFQLNGEFCRDARVLAGDTAFLGLLEAAGHVMGSHFHMHRFTGVQEYWIEIDKATATETQLRQIWSDQISECEASLGHTLARIDPALVSQAIDATPIIMDLFDTYRPAVQPVGEVFSYADWNHKPWNPFRRAPGTKLSEDLSHPIVGLMSLGQVGQLEPAGLHQTMTSVPQIQRQFLALVAEWREAELAGDPPKQWQFGIMTHPHDTITYQADVETLVQWLAAWTDGSRGDGAPLVVFATNDEVVASLEDWEAQWPGVSSFDFDWEGHLETGEEAYPYGSDALVLAWLDTELDQEITTWQESGVTVFRLYTRAVERGEPNEEGARSLTIGELGTEPTYLAWSTTGATVTIDASSLLSGASELLDSQTGSIDVIDANAVEIPSQAVLFRGR